MLVLGAQTCALESLQLYAPMGHAVGLSCVSAAMEDACFQVPPPPPSGSPGRGHAANPTRIALPCRLPSADTGGEGGVLHSMQSKGMVLRRGVCPFTPHGRTMPDGLNAPGLQPGSGCDTAVVQILFPASYSDTADWLRATAATNQGILQRCQARLQQALTANKDLPRLTSGVEVPHPPFPPPFALRHPQAYDLAADVLLLALLAVTQSLLHICALLTPIIRLAIPSNREHRTTAHVLS